MKKIIFAVAFMLSCFISDAQSYVERMRIPQVTTTIRDIFRPSGCFVGDLIYNTTLGAYQFGDGSGTWKTLTIIGSTSSTAYNTSIAANAEAVLTFAITGITTTSAVNVSYTGTLPVSIVVKQAEVTAGQVIVRMANTNTVTAATPNVTVNVTPIKL